MPAECRQRKLLVVDDEPLIRETLTLCLRDEYEITTASSGEEAIEASIKEDFPVVVLDLRMGGISGIETLKKLKEIRDLQNVIILTAYESMDSAIAALNSGAFNYITKPFELAKLKEVISKGFDAYEHQNLRKEEMRQRLMSVHDAFFSLLCHEFNTPLNIIMGFSELLADGLDDKEHITWAREIEKSGTRLHDILMEIVDYIAASNLAASGIENTFTVGALLRPLLANSAEKEVTLQIAQDPDLDTAIVGPANSILMIARKLVRMISHQTRDVEMTVRLARSDSPARARLRFMVTGAWSNAEIFRHNPVEKLFEPYQFSPGSGNGERSSLGLELATCRKIAEYVNGTVDCLFKQNGGLDFVAEIPVKLAG